MTSERAAFNQRDNPTSRFVCRKWTHWGLNPGPSACEADVIPLHHSPNYQSLACVLYAFQKYKHISGSIFLEPPQNRSTLGPDRNMKNTVWPKLGEKRPDGEPKNGAKVENRDLKKWKRHQNTSKIGVFSNRAEI